MSEYKCKGCQWYNKPYWSIINPCDNCPRENANIEIITRWQDPTIEELKTQLQQKEIERLNNIINKALEKINDYKIYCENNKGFTEYTDIEIEAIEPVISKLEDILKEVSE